MLMKQFYKNGVCTWVSQQEMAKESLVLYGSAVGLMDGHQLTYWFQKRKVFWCLNNWILALRFTDVSLT